MALFDAYVMVDWSAAATPRQGADSIWISLVERGSNGLAEQALVNPPTRADAVVWLADRLSDLTARGRTSLLGFDFNFGFPRGFAVRLTDGKADWRTLWRRLAQLVDDRADNGNNRFALAGRLNERLSGGAFPFWGCPAAAAGPTLGQKKPEGFIPLPLSERLGEGTYRRQAGEKHPLVNTGTPSPRPSPTRGEGEELPEFRLVERRARGVQPVWKLYAPGAVGGQTLLGIPRVLALRDHPWLGDHFRVWPFETGLARLERPAPGGIVAAEIYPSLIEADPAPVKDAGQVSALARYFARLDEADRLADLFAGDPTLAPQERAVVETEEGWILGVRGLTRGKHGKNPTEQPCLDGTQTRAPLTRPLCGHPLPRGARVDNFIRDPSEIYRQSFAIIRREADLSRFSGPMEALAIRVVHACGMPDVAAGLAFRPGAAEAGCRALAEGKPILVDAQMVVDGIIRRRLPAANPVICRLDDAHVPALAAERATTRSAAAVRLWQDQLDGAVVAIGNAPTALFELLAMVAEGAPRPALILGFPVGFVGAAESKDALIASDLPFIALPGRRGGSAMAAAAVNALAGEAS